MQLPIRTCRETNGLALAVALQPPALYSTAQVSPLYVKTTCMLRYPRFENEEQPPTTHADEIDRRWRLSCCLWGQECRFTPRPVAALLHPVEPRGCRFSRALTRFVWGIVARYGQ